MTTITIEENINIKKYKFKNILDLNNYLDNYLKKNFCVTELKELKDSKITLGIKKKMQETKKLNVSCFVDA